MDSKKRDFCIPLEILEDALNHEGDKTTTPEQLRDFLIKNPDHWRGYTIPLKNRE